MQFLTIDFETYYDKAFSLSKLTTEEYIRDDLFEAIGVGVKINDEPAVWFSGTHAEIKTFLDQYDWADSVAVAHNAMFDAAILSWVFNTKPSMWVDTLSLARAIDGLEVSGSLKAAAERYGLGVKGEEVIAALGKGRIDFTAADLAQYGEYCKNDCDLTWELWKVYAEQVSFSELEVIDLTIRMFSEPVLELDLPKLEQHLVSVRERKEELMRLCAADSEVLQSNAKFAELLESLGVEPPMKVSARTKKQTYAFAKTDEEFKALADHPDERVQALVAARLGTKSTLEETRTQRFIEIAKRGSLPVPLRYYGAHTGRWGGADKINLQNLPSRGNTDIKDCIVAPEGYVIIDCDSSQIEARMLAWLSGQTDLVEAFAKKEDVYKQMASRIYKIPEEEVNKDQRFIGKSSILGCFSADTQVLTHTWWKRIVDVTAMDMVWDGEEWVTHQGVVPQGTKQVLSANGLEATSDHEILTEHGWVVWSEVTTNPSLFQSALRKANLPLLIGYPIPALKENQPDGIRLFGVLVAGPASLIDTILKRSVLRGVIRAPSYLARKLENVTGDMKILSRMKRIVRVYSTEFRRVLLDVTTLIQSNTLITAGVGFLFTKHGEKIKKNSSSIYSRFRDGMNRLGSWIESMSTEGTNRIIYGLLRVQKIWRTEGKSRLCSKNLPTYDIAYAGPRNRYTVATSAGPLIVHNCGYGMGGKRFRLQLQSTGVRLEEKECELIVETYRKAYPKITALWRQGQDVLEAMIERRKAKLGKQPQALEVVQDGFLLPSGYTLKYPDLRKDAEGEFNYKGRNERVRIFGPKVIENVVQALARCVIAEQMVWISQKYRPVLTVHDAIAIVAKEDEAEKATQFIERCMRKTPDWAEGLPLNCESGVGRSYGEC